MENINEIYQEDTKSILSNLSNEEENINTNEVLTYNGYTCNKCNSIPEITNIDFIKNTIEINCYKHKNEITWNDFINNAMKYNYYFSVCNICNKNIQKNNENIFKYCYDCRTIICENCFLSHNNEHKIINNSDYYNKCPKHFNQTYISYCSYCKENICNECKRSKIHKEHQKYDFIEIEPTGDELAQIQNFFLKYKNSLNIVENSGKKEIEELSDQKQRLLINLEQVFKNQKNIIKEEYYKKYNKNVDIFNKKKDNLTNKYNEDLNKLTNEFNNLKVRYGNELKNNMIFCQNNYYNSKNKIISDFDSLIQKCQKYNTKIKDVYRNITQLILLKFNLFDILLYK